MSTRGSDSRARSLLPGLPLRVRLTLLVLGGYAVIHLTISVAATLFYHQSVVNEEERDTVGVLDEALREAERSKNTSTALERLEILGVNRLSVALADADGRILDSVGPVDRDALVAFAGSQTIVALESEDSFVGSRDGLPPIAVARLRSGELLIIAAPPGAVSDRVGAFVLVLGFALGIGLIAVAAITWFVTGVAVRPLQQVQEFAEELSTDTLEERIQLDETAPEISDLRDELEAAMRRLGEGYDQQARFLANVSHEIKTPISVVRTEAQVLSSGEASREDLERFVTSTAEEMDRLGRTVESFLLLTRIRNGSARIRPKRFDANDVLMESVGYCWKVAEQSGVLLRPSLYDGDESACLEGNADLLQTATSNLIRNAIRFSPRDEAVEIRCVVRQGEIVFEVQDAGPGLPPELIDRVFEPFTQSSEERRRGRGTGLGLQIAQGIADLHGGRISVRNLDKGCVFSFVLPVANA